MQKRICGARKRGGHVPLLERVKPARFEEWLAVYFDPFDKVNSVWERFPPSSDSPEFTGTDEEIAELFAFTLAASAIELADFTDWQLGNGLDNLFNNHFTNIALSIRDGLVSVDQRVRCIKSIKSLYSACLTQRAPPVLGHLSEASPCPALSNITYMLWDVSPLSEWPNDPTMYPIIIDVMGTALQSTNPAVVESGLHGLGHTVKHCEALAVAAIDNFINTRGKHVRAELVVYAGRARTGMIQ